jgi:hypothetical protein
LPVELQRGPVAAAALSGDRARLEPPAGTRLDELHELPARIPLLRFDDAHACQIAGKDIHRENRKAVDSRECGASGDKLVRPDRDLLTDLHESIVIKPRAR